MRKIVVHRMFCSSQWNTGLSTGLSQIMQTDQSLTPKAQENLLLISKTINLIHRFTFFFPLLVCFPGFFLAPTFFLCFFPGFFPVHSSDPSKSAKRLAGEVEFQMASVLQCADSRVCFKVVRQMGSSVKRK